MCSSPSHLRVINNNIIVMTQSDFKNQMQSVKASPKFKVSLPFAMSEQNGTLLADSALFLQGKDNKFPQNLRKILAKSPIYKVGLGYSSQQLAGLGLQTGEIIIENREEVFELKQYPQWDDFAKRSNFTQNFYTKACRAIKTYNMCYVHLSLSQHNTIAAATVLPNTRCRLWGNTNTGEVSHVIVADWDRVGSIINKDNSQSYPVIQNWFDTANTFKDQIIKDSTIKEYVFVLRVPSDDIIYNMPDHFSLVESGLIDYANNIINFKKWVMENITTLNQIMFVTQEYMQSRFPEWESWNAQARKGGDKGKEASDKIDAAYDELAKIFSDTASGVEKSGKMIQAPMFDDGKESLKFVKVDQNTFDSQYNADAGWVETQIHWALQIDAGLYSAVDGKNNNGGSAKTQTFNIAQLNEWIFEQVLLELPQFISDFNGFGVSSFRVRRATMYSSDAISADKRQVQNPTK